jgi:hypothetical protein
MEESDLIANKPILSCFGVYKPICRMFRFEHCIKSKELLQ